jgi:hypothetical protein
LSLLPSNPLANLFIKLLIWAYLKLFPFERIVFNPFFRKVVLYEIGRAIDDVGYLIDTKEFKVLHTVEIIICLTSAQIASPRKKPSISLQAPTISTVSS